jgi:hypothetical protein
LGSKKLALAGASSFGRAIATRRFEIVDSTSPAPSLT